MDGDNRRTKLEELLKSSREPLTGTELAKMLGVSRQVIVQDIALLRACNKNIMSTNKGYLLFHEEAKENSFSKTFYVNHNEKQIRDELYTIVDYGGKVLDVVVEHPIYGQIMVDLIINSRADADDFCERMEKEKTKPLNDLTYGVHFHTVTARDESILIKIEEKLREKGYLVEGAE